LFFRNSSQKTHQNILNKEEDYNELRKSIIEKLNSNKKKLFFEKLQYANELLFRTRLKDFNEDFAISIKDQL